MPIMLTMDPFRLPIKIFSEKYSDEVYIEVSLQCGLMETLDVPAMCRISNDTSRPVEVIIDDMTPIREVPSLLCHELAHAVIARKYPNEMNHGPRWQEIFIWSYLELCKATGNPGKASDLDEDIAFAVSTDADGTGSSYHED